MVRYKQRHLACAWVVIGVLLVAIASSDLRGQGAPQAGEPTGPTTGASRDHFIGWFSLTEPERQDGRVIPGRTALIPIFKRDESFWTVSWGMEVPLKECPEGLEWAASIPNATGTKFGHEGGTKKYYIVIEQQWLQDEYPTEYVGGVKQPIVKVDPPSGMLDSAAEPPRTNDDFIGRYQPAWFPLIRFEVRKEGDKYIWAEEILGPERHIRPARRRTLELAPLADRLGLVLSQHKNRQTSVIYNPAMKRFEITDESIEDGQPIVVRTPLARRPAPPSPDSGDVPTTVPRSYIGVPLSRG